MIYFIAKVKTSKDCAYRITWLFIGMVKIRLKDSYFLGKYFVHENLI